LTGESALAVEHQKLLGGDEEDLLAVVGDGVVGVVW
jgi:hypothetical protein